MINQKAFLTAVNLTAIKSSGEKYITRTFTRQGAEKTLLQPARGSAAGEVGTRART